MLPVASIEHRAACDGNSAASGFRWPPRSVTLQSVWALAVLLFAFWLSGLAHAAAPSAEELARARLLFGEAEVLEQQARWSAAAAKLRLALTIKETPGLRYHVAYCLEQMGHLVEALANYERADELLRMGADAPDVAEQIGAARATLKRRIPTLTFRVERGLGEVKVVVNQRPLSDDQIERSVRLNPGTHRVVVSAPGHEAVQLALTLKEGDREVVRPRLRRSRSAAPSVESPLADSTRADQGPSARTLVLASGAALTAVALGIGIGYSIARYRAADRANEARDSIRRAGLDTEDACRNPAAAVESSCRSLAAANSDGTHASQVATVGWSAAGVAAAATLATWLLWPSAPSGERSPRFGSGSMAGGGVAWAVRAAF